MTTLPKFLEMIQPYDGRDIGTLRQFGRILRESGYIPKGRPGKGAPHLEYQHVVNLLLGIFGSSSPVEAPKQLNNLRQMQLCDFDDALHGQCTVLAEALGYRNFGEVIEYLLENSLLIEEAFIRYIDPENEFDEEKNNRWRESIRGGLSPISLTVKLSSASAEIKAQYQNDTIWITRYTMNPDIFMSGDYNSILNTDRRIIYEFTFKTLIGFYLATVGNDG